MEAWGGIRGFRVLLRRREGARIRAGKAGVGCGDISMDSHSSGSARGGNGPTEGPRRVTRSSTRGKSATTAIADSISEVTSPRTSQNSPSSPTLTPTPSPAGTTRSRAKLRKRPTIASSPVPAWLRADTDPSAIRTFAEVRAIVNRVKADFEELRDRKLSTSAGEGKAVMPKFPDIEILPVFYEGIFVEQQRGRGRARV
ncbi:hypothetical protein PHISCL_10231 [Aspergillus sclerotialis]|uniref:Uncharacterized protein n=1 Tax=Aspergillus sclerotialis TaxID=2070753 RepID=A0A3A2Z2Y1_9EURO|nr:hypothetical protein PHISCL_10231 [Aspergillus sclerotialis]